MEGVCSNCWLNVAFPRSPSVGKRVRRLIIRAWFIEQIMKQERERKEQRTATSGLLASALGALQLKALLSARTEKSLSRKSVAAPEPLLRLMVAAVNNMRNLVCYSLELRDLTLTKESERFFEVARLTMTSTLRRLALHGTVFKLAEHIASFADCKLLEDLELDLDYYSHSAPGSAQHGVLESKQREAEALQEVVVPFINSLNETLRSFTLVSFCSANLSHFFRSLAPLLRLRCLSIKACLDDAHLSDMNALVQFLNNYRFSLQHLDIRPLMPDMGESWVSKENSIQHKNKSWGRVLEALIRSGNSLPALEGLHIPFTSSTDLSMALIRRTTHSLTHLSLMNHPLHMEEVKQVMALFAQRPLQLKSLLIEVVQLSVDLVLLLANRLPGLRTLVLLYDSMSWDTESAFALQVYNVRKLRINHFVSFILN